MIKISLKNYSIYSYKDHRFRRKCIWKINFMQNMFSFLIKVLTFVPLTLKHYFIIEWILCRNMKYKQNY
jgi:hypothetical protein